MQKFYRAFLASDIHCNTTYEVKVSSLPGQEAAGQISGSFVVSRSLKDPGTMAQQCDFQ